MYLCNKREFMFETVQNHIVMIYKSQIEFYAFLYAWIGEAVGNSYSVSVAFSGYPSHIVKIVLVIRVLDMSNEFSPFSGKVVSSSEQVSGRAHFRRIDISHRDHSSPEENSNLMGVDLIVFGFATMDCFHIEGVTQDKWNVFLCAEVCNPIPGEDALHGTN